MHAHNLAAQSQTASVIAERMFSRHRRSLLSIARMNSASPEDAEEAVQDALILFIENYEPDSGPPALAWLILTLKRRCWAIARRAVRENQRLRELARERDHRPSIETLARPEAVVEMREMCASRRRHISELKGDQRTALILIGLGYSYEEVCAMTGWTFTKVNRCIREGRAKLMAVERRSSFER